MTEGERFVVYLIGPYRAPHPNGILENIMRARAAAVKLWKLGAVVICPHLNTALMDGCLPDEDFLSGGRELILRADSVALMPNWNESAGSRDEYAFAYRTGKGIYYMEDPASMDALESWIKSEYQR